MRRPVGVKWIRCVSCETNVFLPPSSHCRHASIRTLEERFVSLGACWAFSVQPVLPYILRPKSFAGLFGAAPSIALATLALTVASEGRLYAATEGRSMIAGATAFFAYASLVSWILMRGRSAALTITIAAMPIWFGMAFGLWDYWLK